MPDFEFNCRHCQHPLVCDEAECGGSITCPQCQKSLRIPRPGRPERVEITGEYPKATLALVCGILGLVLCGPFTGIVAVIFGHLGLAAISRSGGTLGGHGKCLAAVIMGYCSIFFICIVGILAAMLLPALGAVREKANVTKCKNNLKQMGICIQVRFSDGLTTHMPTGEEAAGLVDRVDAEYWGFDQFMTKCPAAHQDGSSTYVWNPNVAGAEWSTLNSPSVPLIWDATPHKVSNKVNVLFGDGHVEERPRDSLP
ncbi:MAG: hypothetical protein RL095_778 [Verrucomicrobiota bacterium]|jgi:prepilin-type processing-associated H-X9-DG protein